MPAIEEAIRYPMERDDWVKTVVIGGVLTILGFLVIPIIPVYGYIVRAIRHSLDGNSEPPTFGDWEELFVDGVKVLVIGIVYSIIPVIVFSVTVGGSIMAMATGTRGGAAAGAAGLSIGLLITLLLALAFGYVGVAGLLNFAAEGRVGAAFDVGTIIDLALSSEYAIAWLLSAVLFIVASIVISVLNVVPFLGTIVGAFVIFYADVVAANLWAGGYNDALSAE